MKVEGLLDHVVSKRNRALGLGLGFGADCSESHVVQISIMLDADNTNGFSIGAFRKCSTRCINIVDMQPSRSIQDAKIPV